MEPGRLLGGLWGLLFGGMMLTIPVVGPLAAPVFAALSGTVEGAIVVGGLGALGAALFSIGIPEHSVIQYEQALKGDQLLVMGHGPLSEMGRAGELLKETGPVQLDLHAGAQSPAARAA